jgi:hypothetical protein
MTIDYWREGGKNEEGKSLWSGEGLKYFQHAEKK